MIKIRIKHSESERYLNTGSINKFSVQMKERILFNMVNGELIIGDNDYAYMEKFNKIGLEGFIKSTSIDNQLDTYLNKENICFVTPNEMGCTVHMLNGEDYNIQEKVDIFL